MEEVLKCPLCEKTYTNNKGEGLTVHLKKVHKISTIEEMMARFPEIAHHFNCKIREKSDSIDKIQCKICGRWMTAKYNFPRYYLRYIMILPFKDTSVFE